MCGPGGRFGFRESIFKIGHSKSRKKVQNPDPRSYVARGSLHLGRGVYEGGGREGSQGSEGTGEQWGGEGWRLRSERLPSPLAAGPELRPGRRPPPAGSAEGPRGSAVPPLSPSTPAAPWAPRQPCGCLRGGGAIEGVRVLAASRFLKSAIVNREKKFKTRTLGRMWRACLCIWPGGSMKGAERHRRLRGRRRLGRMSG